MILIISTLGFILLYPRTSHNIRLTYIADDSVDTTKSSSVISQIPDPNYFFDPNICSIKELQKLGFSNFSIINLKKYLEEGGKLHEPVDLLKIKGVDSSLYYSVVSHIKFGKVANPLDNRNSNSLKGKVLWLDFNTLTSKELRAMGYSIHFIDSLEEIRDQYWITKKFIAKDFGQFDEKYQIEAVTKNKKLKNRIVNDEFVIELNSADSTQLMSLRGIGSVLSNRIIKYRHRLGGFYTVEQLTEVYGLEVETIKKISKYIIIDTLKIQSLDINKCSLKQLKDHPYLGFYKAKDILDFRNKNGKITDLNQVFKLNSFKESEFERLKYYLKF